MIITNFDSFNEGFLGVDLKKIKQEAQNFAKTKECVKLFSQVDTDILDSVVEELKKLKEKWGSIDILGQKLLTKADASNEGIGSVIILSMFGIHAFMKLLSALKNSQGFLEYLGRLFWSKGYNDFGRSLRDILIMIVFLCYVIGYLIASNSFTGDHYKTSTGAYTNISFKWNGIHDYVYQDGVNKQYDVKRNSDANYDIFYKGKKIGTTDMDYIYRLDGKKVMTDISNDNLHQILVNLDLEKVLTGKYNQKTETEVEIRQKEIDRLKHEIDSLNTKAYENVDMAKKIFRDAGKDYDEIVSTPREKLVDRDWIFVSIKDSLTQGNNIGYLGLFANIIVNDRVSLNSLENLYSLIKRNKDIINNLRDNNGNLCSLFDFKKYETASDALERLSQWREVNQFMREIPSAQKRLIWQDGYYTDELKSKSQFLTSAIIKISNDDNLSRTFLSKISAAKTTDVIVDSIVRITNQQPWDFDYWLNKLNNTRNVYVTWSSKEKNQIICIVTTYSTIKKIAYMTNWCITRSSSYFRSYSKNGFQCILYDFNYPITSNDSVIGFSLNDKNDRYKITDCHNKSDHSTRLPSDFVIENNYGNRWNYDRSIKPEFVQVNLAKAALKFDNTFLKVLRDKTLKPVRTFLNKPGIAKFIDFYDED
jgi:hypothetical protein